MQKQAPKRIKSFVLRQGRMTIGQQSAYENLWDKYGIGARLRGTRLSENDSNPSDLPPLDFEKLFNNQNPVNLEIGFGMGDSLIEMAQNSPDNNFLGIEVHTPGLGRILQRIEQFQIKNIRVFHADAITILQQQIPLSSLNAVYLYFPDPWHKRKHRKRRIVKQQFIELIYSRLADQGVFHLATDWEDYATEMLKNINQAITTSHIDTDKTTINFVNQSASDDFYLAKNKRPHWRPKTKFENKGIKKGHGIWDLLFRKVV